MSETWALLLKFGVRQHIEQFREEGLLYMNPITYFAKREASLNIAQADPFEGTDLVLQPGDLRSLVVTCGDTKTVLGPEHLVGSIKMSLGKTPLLNVFCMYALTDPTANLIADPRNFDFGETFVMVRNTDEFIHRVASAGNSAGYQVRWGPVEYFDENCYSGETGPFRKASRFRYQNEFRFVISPGSFDALELRIGDLSDITTETFPLEQINDLIQFQVEETGS